MKPKPKVKHNIKPPVVKEQSLKPAAAVTSPRKLVPDMLAWVMKNPQERATVKSCYKKFRPAFVYPISLKSFRTSLEGINFGSRLAELRSGSASPALVKQSAKAMVDSFLEERRRRGIKHITKMYKAVDKIHQVFDKVDPEAKTLNGYVKTAQEIHSLGRSVFNLDKEDEKISTNQINVAVLIGKKEDDDAIIDV